MNMVFSSLHAEADVLCWKLKFKCWIYFYIHYIDLMEFDVVHDGQPTGRSRWLCFKIYVQMLNPVWQSLHWLYWIWCCPWWPAFRKKQMAMLQNSCAKVNCSFAFVTLILSNYKNQWIQICQRAYDAVQPSEWSRQKKLILNAFLLLDSVHS